MSGSFRRWRRRRGRLPVTLAGIVVVLVAVGVGAYLYERHRTGSIYHPHARFVAQPTPGIGHGPDRFAWPFYGYSPDHTRYFPSPSNLHPPFRRVWQHNLGSLLEFPPVIKGDHIFQLSDDATLHAISVHTGRPFWERHLGTLSASTPAVAGKIVYDTILETGTSSGPGRVVAVDYTDGKTIWSRPLSSPSESSPLVDKGVVFFGSQSGKVYALNAKTGSVIWTYQAPGSVKGSPTLSGGVLYFGDYSGHVQAISERTGDRIWISGSEGALFGSGTFYSTPAVVYGRVFLGNTDGRIYAYDAGDGSLDWAVQTGAYVYASPAVTNAPGLGPTIFLGSYDGTFYALNARTGAIDWRYNAHGRISGSATIVGHIVYFADLGTKHTFGLSISSGRVVFEMDTGSFDPVISNSKYIFLSGTTGLYELAPVTPVAKAATPAKGATGATR